MDVEATDSWLTRLARGWGRFWFTPADPTPLCLMRIATGVLTLYVHIAYCFDFVAFFGPDGWCSQELSNKVRQTMPHVGPMPDWAERQPKFTMPGDVRQREALRGLLDRLIEWPGTEDNLRFMRGLASAGEERDELLRFVRDNSEPFADDTRIKAYLEDRLTPEERELLPRLFARHSTAPERREFVAGVIRLQGLLSADPESRAKLVQLLTETNQRDWEALQGFIGELKQMPPAERARYLDLLSFWGIPPDYAYATGLPVYSPWFHVTDTRLMWAIHGLHLFFIVLFTLGMYTRVTSVMTWLVAMSYIHRAQPYLFGQDTMMNLSLFYLMLSPCGAKWSLDRWMARQAAEARGQSLPPVAPSVSAGFVLRVFQIQYCLMYLSAGMSKLKGTAWWNATAMFGCMANPEFSPMHVGAYRDFLRWLCGHRPLWEVVNAGASVFTILTELSFPFLAWTPMRPVVVTAAIFLHTGIAILMGLSVFSLFMFSMLLCWIPADAINWLFEPAPPKAK